mgnify:CR=1 FL=1
MIHVLVVAGKSTNNVVESSKSPVITGFFRTPKTSEYTLDPFWIPSVEYLKGI